MLGERFYKDLRKYAQDKLEEIIEEERTHKFVDIHPLKVSLINISMYCTNVLIKMGVNEPDHDLEYHDKKCEGGII